MSEQKLQAMIIKYLEARKFYVIKTVTTTKSGTPDLICCSPKGDFIAIEVKLPGGKLSALQEYTIRKITEVNGVAFAVWGWDDFVDKFNSFVL